MVLGDLEAVEAAFFDAAINPAGWPQALNLITAQTDAFGAVLIPVAGNLPPNVPCSDRMAEYLRAYFRGARHVQDEFNRGRVIMTKNGVADDLKNADEMNNPAYFQDLLAPTALGWWAGMKVEGGDDPWYLSIQRLLEQKPFSPEEKCQLAQLSKSLSSAVAISRNIGLATTTAALDAFEISDTAVLLIDRLGSVIRANQSAEQLLKGDVKISGGKLVSKDQKATRAVEQALHKFLGTGEAAPTAPIPLSRDWQRPLLVYLLKLSSLSGNPFAECQAMAVLVDPARCWVPTEMALRATFGFTPAEARLASKISDGAALDAVAVSLGITKQTLRSLLKIVFAKAGVHRQAELVALLGSTASTGKSSLGWRQPRSSTSN